MNEVKGFSPYEITLTIKVENANDEETIRDFARILRPSYKTNAKYQILMEDVSDHIKTILDEKNRNT